MAIRKLPEQERLLTLFPQLVRRVDPDVRDVVLIGSSIYAPDLARDYDLVVTTTSSQDEILLMEQIADVLKNVSDKTVDIIVRHPGDTIGDLARAILAGEVLWGPGDQTQREARHFFEERGGVMNSFKQARDALGNAEDIIRLAETTEDPGKKDRRYRNAFNELFDATRIAALTYLGRDDTAWTGVARELPWPYDSNFRDMIKTLHVRYAYDGNYTKDPKLAAKEFEKWKDKVEEFVNDLERRSLNREQDR